MGPVQAVGPIPLNLRCGTAEHDLKPPFVSRPDLGEKDLCKPSYQTRSPSDIRAYEGINGDVTSIILARTKPKMTEWTVKDEITPDKLREWVLAAGYSLDKLHTMAKCLKP